MQTREYGNQMFFHRNVAIHLPVMAAFFLVQVKSAKLTDGLQNIF
jgi:hypothetical protein